MNHWLLELHSILIYANLNFEKRKKMLKKNEKGSIKHVAILLSWTLGEYPRLGNLDLLGIHNSSIDKTTHEVKGERGLKPLGLLAVVWRKMG